MDTMAKAPKIIEVPDAPEIFADGVANVAIRRNVARLTLVSERVDPNTADDSNRVVVGHVAMNLAGFLDLHARMQNIVNQMRDRGTVVQRDQDADSAATKTPAAKKAPAKKSAAKKSTRRKKT